MALKAVLEEVPEPSEHSIAEIDRKQALSIQKATKANDTSGDPFEVDHEEEDVKDESDGNRKSAQKGFMGRKSSTHIRVKNQLQGLKLTTSELGELDAFV